MFVNFAFLRETVVLLINYLHYAVYFLIREPLKLTKPTTFCYDLDGIANLRTKTALNIVDWCYFNLKPLLDRKFN